MKIHSLIWVGAIFAADRGKNFYLDKCDYDYEFECEFEFEYECECEYEYPTRGRW